MTKVQVPVTRQEKKSLLYGPKSVAWSPEGAQCAKLFDALREAGTLPARDAFFDAFSEFRETMTAEQRAKYQRMQLKMQMEPLWLSVEDFLRANFEMKCGVSGEFWDFWPEDPAGARMGTYDITVQGLGAIAYAHIYSGKPLRLEIVGANYWLSDVDIGTRDEDILKLLVLEVHAVISGRRPAPSEIPVGFLPAPNEHAFDWDTGAVELH